MINFKVKHVHTFIAIVLGACLTVIGGTIVLQSQSDPLHLEPLAGEEERYRGMRRGDIFTFSRTACVSSDLLIEVHREMINLQTGASFLLGNVQYAAVVRETPCFPTTFTAAIPDHIPAGEYYYRPVLIYSVNPIKMVTKDAPGVFVQVID